MISFAFWTTKGNCYMSINISNVDDEYLAQGDVDQVSRVK